MEEIYGRLKPLRRLPFDRNKKSRSARYLCKCLCGNEIIVSKQSLLRGYTKSCGCLYKETRVGRPTHGLTKHPLYKKWRYMVDRCSPKHHSRKHYFDKGIAVSKRWKTFSNFVDDMYGTYIDGLELDRIDNTLGYSKSNCRWSTRKQQCNNKRNNVLISLDGETKTVSEWAAKTGIKYQTIRSRLLAGMPSNLILSNRKISKLWKHQL